MHLYIKMYIYSFKKLNWVNCENTFWAINGALPRNNPEVFEFGPNPALPTNDLVKEFHANHSLSLLVNFTTHVFISKYSSVVFLIVKFIRMELYCMYSSEAYFCPSTMFFRSSHHIM